MDQAASLRVQLAKKSSGRNIDDGSVKTPRIIAVTSGKGGTGKTNVVANLAYALSTSGQKVMVLDADLGLGNIDVLLGIAPRHTIQDVIKGDKKLSDVLVKGPGGMKILPAGTGVQELSHLTEGEKLTLLSEIDLIDDDIDTFFIDTGAGISSNVMYFNVAAQEIIVVVSPEPTAITDAYAIIKILSTKYCENHFKLLVNEVKNEMEAMEVYNNICNVADRFLNISIDYFGYILFDKNVNNAVMNQKVILELYPESPASKCLRRLAKNLKKSSYIKEPKGNMQFFWKRLLQGLGE